MLLVVWCIGGIVMRVVLVWWKWRIFFGDVCYLDGSYFFLVVVDCFVWVILLDVNLCIIGSIWCGDCWRLVGCYVIFNGIGVLGINVGFGFGMWMIDWGVGRSGKWVLLL